jgi:CRISPR-associated protein Cmr4
MKQKLLYLFTRTPLHVGAGSSVGAIDQPIQRERHTGFPIIPGSSIKGVLKDHFRNRFRDQAETWERVANLFGRGGDDEQYEAGGIAFGEARLLAFPVRSAKGSFALVSSTLALQRFDRDAQLGLAVPPALTDMSCLAGNRVTIERGGHKGVVLEEYRFCIAGAFPAEWEKVLCSLLRDAVLAGAAGRFVLLSDGDLSHFATSACQVNQHVRIDDETGTAKDQGLYNEETVPSEALLYSTLTVLPRGQDENPVFAALAEEQLVQFGGNGTTGLGFCTIKLAQ